jgi:hypothetical protein
MCSLPAATDSEFVVQLEVQLWVVIDGETWTLTTAAVCHYRRCCLRETCPTHSTGHPSRNPTRNLVLLMMLRVSPRLLLLVAAVVGVLISQAAPAV